MQACTIEVAGCSLTAGRWGHGPIEIVMLHDGLGSLSQWRSVPADVHARSGATVLVYERAGHGTSTPIPDGPWPPDWMHREAEVLAGVLDAVDAQRPLLVGHSDGGSTALIHASGAGQTIRGVVALASHSWVEDICYESIVAMRADRAGLERALARHHAAPVELFEAWSGGWVSAPFRSWDIRPLLATIEVPTLVVQGSADPYATVDQPRLTAEAVGPNGRWRLLDGLGHTLHHDDADQIVDLIAQTWAEVSRR